MSRRNARKKKGVNPAFAILLLLGSAGFVAKSLWSGSVASLGVTSTLATDDEFDLADDEREAMPTVQWVDLLAAHGSYDASQPVRVAFSTLPESVVTAAVPGGETVVGGRGWIGEDPPLLRVGVVMISEQARRAVLAGVVVGVGDAVMDSEVIAIDPGVVRMHWRGRVLTYDLDGEAPREFRAEQQRRRAKQQAATGVDDTDASSDPEGEENQR